MKPGRRIQLFALPRRALGMILGVGAAMTVTFAAIVLCTWQVVVLLESGVSDKLALLLWIIALTASIALNAAFRALEFNVTEAIGFRMVQRLRLVIYDHMSGMAPRQIQHRSRGSLILRLTGDLSMLRTWISRGIGRGVISLLLVTSGLAILAFMSLWLAAAVFYMFVLGGIASHLLGKVLQRRTARVRKRRSLLTSNIDEQVAALAVVQISGRSRGEAARLSQQNDALTRVLLKEATVRGWLRAISTGTGWLAVAAVLAVGGNEVFAGRMSLATLIAAIMVVRHMSGPARALGFAHDYWRRAMVSQKKIGEFLNSSSRNLAHPGKAKLAVRKGRIEFDAVAVDGALHPFTAAALPGQHIAVIGANGAGKSTLLSLVARLQEPAGGEIRIDGMPLADCTLQSTFRQIGMVSSDLPLMRGSVFRNLTYRKPSATDEEIRRVILTCRLDELLRELPDGLESWITEGGKNLSTGQRQQLCLARAMLGNPPILLLDEPCANLDQAGRELFLAILSRYNGTVLMATHDLQAAETAHQVWHLHRAAPAQAMSGDDFHRLRLAGSHGDRSLQSVA